VSSFPAIRSIGQPSAEEDAVLEYFLTTDSVRQISSNEVYLVLGRKGSGKTALVRHFTKDTSDPFARALNLRGYPWALHSDLANSEGSEIEAYVASWRYVIAAQAASAVLEAKWNHTYEKEEVLRRFFVQNYGAPIVDVDKVFRPSSIVLDKATIQPKVGGIEIGSVELKQVKSGFGQQIDAVATAIIDLVCDCLKWRGKRHIELHFDELDFGIEKFERQRELMIVGLVLAVQSFRGQTLNRDQRVRPFVYLRQDLWDSFTFSDRNKISRGPAINLKWDKFSLQQMVNTRLKKITGSEIVWDNLIDDQLMRGKQPKWDYIVARTLDRPRDIISFFNIMLDEKNDEGLLSNDDVARARPEYSTYFKEELDDEVKAHWPLWEEALSALRDIGFVTFTRQQFEESYARVVSSENSIQVPMEALEKLFGYSVVAYLRPKSGGGRDWIWKYKSRTSNFDGKVESFRVHPGLTEFLALREERRNRKSANGEPADPDDLEEEDL
jgi:hypothetical protein